MKKISLLLLLLLSTNISAQIEEFNREALIVQSQQERIQFPKIVIWPPAVIIEDFPIFHFDYKMGMSFDITTPFHFVEPFVTLGLSYLITKDKKFSRTFAYTFGITSEFVDGINSDQGWDWGDVLARIVGFILVEKYIIR